ncbi:MAG: hypothetical protein HFJ51_02280 [Clostridia bacterium]|nr:hypothetical protein [Clostridia bacterium]
MKFGECRRAIYRWRTRYDGSIKSLEDKSRRPHYHPNQHTEEELKLIKNSKNSNIRYLKYIFFQKSVTYD